MMEEALDSLHNRLNALEEYALESIVERIAELEDKCDGLESTVEDHEDQIDELDDKLDELTEEDEVESK